MLKKIFTLCRNFRRSRCHARQRGGVLIGAVIVMVVMGVLGAGMVAMLGSTAVQEVRANYGERAYYLAESGYRFAESTRLRDSDAFWALDDDLDVLSYDHSVVVDDPDVGGKFTINLVKLMKEDGGEYDDTANVDGDQSVDPTLDPSDPDYRVYLDVTRPNVDFKLPHRFGLFRHQGSWYRYHGFTNVDGDTDRLARVLSVDTNRKVDGNQTIDAAGGGSVNLAITGGPAIALSEGTFRRGGVEFSYESYSDNTLYTVSPDGVFTDGEVLTFPSKFPLDATGGDEIVLAPMVRIISTGEYPGSGLLNAIRTVHYEQIAYKLPTFEGGEPPMSFDPGDPIWNKPNDPDEWSEDDWIAGPGSEGEGDPLGDYIIDYAPEGEDPADGAALKLASMNPSEEAAPSTMVMFQASQITVAAYQVQVKIKLSADLLDQYDPLDPESLLDDPYNDCPYYVAGITFRKQADELNEGNTHSYGLSFLRGQEKTAVAGRLIPNVLVPENNIPYIVLWRYDSNPNTQTPITVLAYKQLTTDATVIDSDELVEPWSTLLIRIEQLENAEGELYNRIVAMYAHATESPDEGDEFKLNEPKLRSPRNGLPPAEEGGDYYLPWPPNNLDEWIPERDYFTVVQWDSGSAGGGATLHDGIYVDTAPGEYLFQAENLLEVGLHSWGHNLAGNLWFDDFGIVQAAAVEGADQEYPFTPPVTY